MQRIADAAIKRIAGLDPFPEPPIIPLRTPVVLMHGFGLLAAFRRGGMLHGIAMHLRQYGIHAYAPNVAPYETVPTRAGLWKDRLTRILDETGTDRLHLIAHSMGGLDARYLISEMGFHDRVETLTTISSPHHGTAIAEFILDQPDRLRTWMADFAHWMSEATMEQTSADFRRAVAEMTPDYVASTFNPAIPDHPSVRYYSYAGQAGKGTDVAISPILRPFNAWLHARDGVNDGLIAVDKARWGTFLGTLDADHSQQVGLSITLRNTFDAPAFYRSLVERLALEYP